MTNREVIRRRACRVAAGRAVVPRWCKAWLVGKAAGRALAG